jgi:hypothetical protein
MFNIPPRVFADFIRSAIAIRAPGCAFASPAFSGMSIVCDISAAARPGCRAKKGLPALVRLRKRAQDALVIASRAKIPNTKQPKPKMTETEEDDLSHLSGAIPKLRRVGSSPGRKVIGSPVGITQVLAENNTQTLTGGVSTHDEPSPLSIRSIATSDTLAEVVHYDSSGRLLDMSGNSVGQYEGVPDLGGGIVPPPPPIWHQGQGSPVSDTWNDYARPAEMINWSLRGNGNISSSPSLQQYDEWPNLDTQGDQVPDTWLVMENGRGGMDLDMSMIFGQGEGTGMGMQEDIGGDGEFDFNMFVNNLGGGGLGLGERF